MSMTVILLFFFVYNQHNSVSFQLKFTELTKLITVVGITKIKKNYEKSRNSEFRKNCLLNHKMNIGFGSSFLENGMV